MQIIKGTIFNSSCFETFNVIHFKFKLKENGSFYDLKSLNNPVRLYFLFFPLDKIGHFKQEHSKSTFMKFDFQCPKLKTHDLWQDG